MFFWKILNVPDSCFSLFSLGVSVCTHTRQVEHQRCSSSGRVQKNHEIEGKNTIFNEQPVEYEMTKIECTCVVVQVNHRLTRQACALLLIFDFFIYGQNLIRFQIQGL